MQKINVLVTGVGGGGIGEQIMKALRMAETPYNIVATDMTPVSKGLYEADKSYVVPIASDKYYVDEILEICQKERVVALAIGSEPELVRVSKDRSRFEELGVLLLMNNSQVIDTCMDKWVCYNFLMDNGFSAPRSLLVSDRLDTISYDIGARLKLPVIIKPAQSSSGSSNVFIAQDLEEAEFFVEYLVRGGFKVIIQEYVGSYDEEYTVGVLTDISDGSLVGSIALKRQILSGLSNRLKIRDVHSDILAVSSGISQGVIDDFPEVRHCCEEIATKLGSRGLLNIQCRKSCQQIYPFEINPRFSGTTSLRAMVGFNEPDILIRKHILGETILCSNYKKGVIVRGLSELYIPFDQVAELKTI